MRLAGWRVQTAIVVISVLSGLIALVGAALFVAFRATQDPLDPAWILSCHQIATVTIDGGHA